MSFEDIGLVAQAFREDRFYGGAALLIFGALALPKKVHEYREFFGHFMEPYPLPRYRAGGVRDVHIVAVRRMLLFYVLFLTYQFAQFALSIPRTGAASMGEVAVDAAIQLALLTGVFASFAEVVGALQSRFAHDLEKREAIQEWLQAKLAGLNVTPRSLFWQSLWLFVASFIPLAVVFFSRSSGSPIAP
jgi:hypothetical protein